MSFLQSVLLFFLFSPILFLVYQPFPYNTSQDILDQCAQVHGQLSYNNVHAIGHTLFLKLLLDIYDNLTFVVVFQMAMVAVLHVFFANYFYSKGLPLFLIAFLQGVSLAFIRNSTNAFFAPWKDTPAALCLGVVCLILMRYIDSGKLSKRTSVILGLALAWCYLFRLNGIVALIFCGGFMSISLLKKKLFPQLILLTAVVAASILTVTLYSDNVLHTINRENGFSMQVFGSGIAAVVNEGELSPQELEEIYKVLPVEWMTGRDMRELVWEYDNSPRITSDPNMHVYNNEYILRLGENKTEVIALYLKLLPSHFIICVKDVLQNIGIIWKFDESFFVSNYIFQFSLLAIIACGNHLRGKEWIPFFPSLCSTISIMISTTTNETRYLLPTFMLAPCLILYCVVRAREHANCISA